MEGESQAEEAERVIDKWSAEPEEKAPAAAGSFVCNSTSARLCYEPATKCSFQGSWVPARNLPGQLAFNQVKYRTITINIAFQPQLQLMLKR